MIKCDLYFSLARTALKVGVLTYKIDKKKILLPSFICNSVVDTLEGLGVCICSYNLDDDLEPEWSDIESQCENRDISAIVMVHYFGQANNISNYEELCKKYNLLLIEDNAHGFSGYYKGKLLGNNGDIGISSPRKFLSTSDGGCLYLKSESAIVSKKILNILEPARSSLKKKLTRLIYNYPRIYLFLKKNRSKWIDNSNPYFFQESLKGDSFLSQDEVSLINKSNWKYIAHERRELWRKWSLFAKKHGLHPIFSDVNPESCPWAFPVYAKDLQHRNKWIQWGLENNILIFSWPSLSTSEIVKKSQALARWERVLCFPLDGISPEELNDAAKNTDI
jgi:perosamine synthetase